MTDYRPPLDDMRFVIREIADLPGVLTLPGWEELDLDTVDAVLEEAGRFGAEVLGPLNVAGDKGCVFENGVVRTPDGFADAWQQFVDSGWNSLAFEGEVGGQGLPCVLSTAVSEIWCGANMAFSLCPMLTEAAGELLAHHGDENLRSQYLPKLVSGEWTGTMLLTEPQAGSDLGRVRTRARPDGDHWRLSGQKIFITFGEHDMAPNIIHLVLARTPNAPEGVKGISLFLVPKFLPGDDGQPGARNDVRCVSIEHKLGIRGSPTAVLALGDNDGAIGYMVGSENRGLDLMFTMMNHARMAVGLEGVGIADRAYQEARAYALERVQGRDLGSRDPAAVAIAHHPDVQRMLLSMKAVSEGARALAYFTAAAVDRSQRHPDPDVRARQQRLVGLLTPVVKAWCTDVGILVADQAIQVHGGTGYIEESGVPQFLRDARIASIYEGTNGIQAMDLVGRKVAGDGGAAAQELIADIEAFAGAAAEPDEHADAAVIRQRLAVAVAELAEATRWLVHTYPSDPRRAAAGAVFYLRLLGDVAAGWLMAKAARHSAGNGSGLAPAFVEAKRLVARCFADTRLVEAAAMHAQLVGIGESLARIDVDKHL
ncbi:MAG: acyl-CoA dehydrogenase [Rhodospirillales bacterium]|nr:acyl-CoA dehydrogenase [Rhodospirillales bacterium]